MISFFFNQEAAAERKATVTEVTFCNSISVSEHVCMMILGLVRNYIPSYNQVVQIEIQAFAAFASFN